MKTRIVYCKELTLAEVGQTNTRETYIRLPNDFDHELFFGNLLTSNGTVMEANFDAVDTTNGLFNMVPLRFAYFHESNREKRIPSLGALFQSHHIKAGDIVRLECIKDGENARYKVRFYKQGEITIKPNAIYYIEVEEEHPQRNSQNSIKLPLQQIFYGAPGTGKSYEINQITKDKEVIRTTFHPDSDYSTFVGAYKPTSIEVPVRDVTGKVIVEDGKQVKENRIVYEFVEQAFLQAYTKAWKAYSRTAEGERAEEQYLVIEEINRGNCAQIFGDLFQLLDRNSYGFSDYPITADKDMKKQLAKTFTGITIQDAERINSIYDKDIVSQVLNGDVLLLPDNLYIWATMNTSDQSLFPIDSAFKRRWDWKYVPISEGHDEEGNKLGHKIEVKGKKYDWWDFVEKINNEIGEQTKSEDKKLGYFFCKAQNGIISAETFVSKVVFYLWNDVFKDQAFASNIFQDGEDELTFNKFYDSNANGKTIIKDDKVELFLHNLGIEQLSDAAVEEVSEEEDEDANSALSLTRNYDKYSVNGIGSYGKNRLATEIVKEYIRINPEMSAEEVLDNWKRIGMIVPHFIESKEEFDSRTDNSKRSNEIPCGDTFIYVAHDGYGANGKAEELTDAVNRQNWGIRIEKTN